MTRGDIALYTDILLLETALGDPMSFVKTGQSDLLSNITSAVRSYFSQYFDPSNKTDSIINMLAPAGIYFLLRSIGFGKMGLLAGLASSMFHIDIGSLVSSMASSILDSIKGTIQKGEQVQPSQLNGAVNNAIQTHATEGDQPQAFDKREFNKEIRDARILRLALEQYEQSIFQLRKEGSPARFTSTAATKAGSVSVLGRILGFIFEIILMAGGFMLAGDVANKFLGRPNAIDHTWHAGQGETSAAPAPTTTQTKFPVNPSYSNTPAPAPWVVNVSNDPSSIENVLVGFTKDVYTGLDGKEGAIRNSPSFKAVADQIAWYNHTSAGEPQVYIPTMYSSKKALVDHYIDEVAKNAP